MIQGFLLIAAGILVILNAVYMHVGVTFSAMMMDGAADGPTAVFYAGKLGGAKPWLWGVVGAVVIVGGIVRIIRARR